MTGTLSLSGWLGRASLDSAEKACCFQFFRAGRVRRFPVVGEIAEPCLDEREQIKLENPLPSEIRVVVAKNLWGFQVNHRATQLCLGQSVQLNANRIDGEQEIGWRERTSFQLAAQ